MKINVAEVTLYVAGPMSGYEGNNYVLFDHVTDRLVQAGYQVENPVTNEGDPHRPDPTPWQWYVRAGLKQLLRCDGVAVLPHWEASRGARLEVDVAHGLNMPVMPWQVWERRATMKEE